MQINLIPDSSIGSAPAGFTQAIQAAAQVFDRDFPGNYTVNISYGWGTYDGVADDSLTDPNSGDFSLGGNDNEFLVSYATVKSWLGAEAAIATLPNTLSYPAYSGSDGYPPGTDVVEVSSSQEKALGEYTGSSGAVDGSIGFNVGDTSDPDYWETAAFVEIGHALGWFTGYETASTPTLLDLFRYGSPGVYQWTGGQPAYFSLDGGATDVADFSTSFDYTLFTNVPPDEPFNLDTNKVTTQSLSSLDIEIFNLLGFGLPDAVSETTPQSLSATAGVSAPIAGVEVIDAGAGDDTFTTTVAAGSGVVTASGAGVSGSGSHRLGITGALVTVNAALATLGYENSGAGADSITITTTDLANQSSAEESVSVGVASITVADFLANEVSLDLVPGGFEINDSAADVSAAFNALNADSHIDAITLDDSGEPILTLTVAQALDDTTAIGAITNASIGIDIVDTAADLAALLAGEIAALAAEHAIALISSDATVRYTASQSGAILAAGLTVEAPADDSVRESFADGTSARWIFGAADTLVKTVRAAADGSFDVLYHGPPGTFVSVTYATYDVAFSASGARSSRTYYDASGAVVGSQLFTANGGHDDYVGGTLVIERDVQSDGAFDVRHFGAAGTIGTAEYASLEVAFQAPGARSDVTYYGADDDVVAVKTFMTNGGFTLDIGGTLYKTRTVNADGSFEAAFYNVTGEAYTSDQNDFAAIGVESAHSTDEGSGGGTLELFGSGLQISQAAGTIGPSAAAMDFFYTSHPSESYAFAVGATDDTLTLTAGFGAATIAGFGAAGASSDILNLSGLFASFTDAQAAMRSSGDDTIIVDGRDDSLTLLGASTSSLSAARLGFG